MSDYIEFFKLESKCLYKDFKKNDSAAVAECQNYFGNRTNLTLMNVQHVVAKKYGFSSWNELIRASNGELAEALINLKNQKFSSPFSTWGGNGSIQIENEKIDLNEQCHAYLDKLVDSHKKVISLGYGNQSVDVSTVNDPLNVNLRHADVSGYDFSNFHISRLLFNEYTIWPADEKKMPQGPAPLSFLTSRKTPGLNLKQLHKNGITGKSRNIAMISNSKLVDHIEYHNNVIDYHELGPKYDNNGASGYVSLVIGKKCGVAPKANLYYYAVSRDNEAQGKRLVDYAIFINQICNFHEELIAKQQNGIDAICLAHRIRWHEMSDDEGFEMMEKAIERTKSLGIFVVSNSINHDYGFNFGNASCKADGDIDKLEDYEVLGNKEIKGKLFFPFKGSTVADFTKLGSYMYSPFAIYGSAWLSGLYVLAKSVRPDLTPKEFWKHGEKTAHPMQNGERLINPVELINSLLKKLNFQ